MYGDKDSLVDINVMRTQLPPHTIVHRLRGYEHLDVLWGKNVHNDVIPYVLEHLKCPCEKDAISEQSHTVPSVIRLDRMEHDQL